MSGALPIAELIADRCRALGITRADLVRLSGYTNVPKGLRRLDALCEGNLRGTSALAAGFPSALGLDAAVIETAVEETRAELRARDETAQRTAEAKYRATFVPHGVVLTERDVPQPIFIAALIGVDRLLRIELDSARHRSTFATQALDALRHRMGGKSGRAIPAFGDATGFVINYTSDRAVRFDLAGSAVEVLPKAVELRQAPSLV